VFDTVTKKPDVAKTLRPDPSALDAQLDLRIKTVGERALVGPYYLYMCSCGTGGGACHCQGHSTCP
jgi:hypothetical protein